MKLTSLQCPAITVCTYLPPYIYVIIEHFLPRSADAYSQHARVSSEVARNLADKQRIIIVQVLIKCVYFVDYSFSTSFPDDRPLLREQDRPARPDQGDEL